MRFFQETHFSKLVIFESHFPKLNWSFSECQVELGQSMSRLLTPKLFHFNFSTKSCGENTLKKFECSMNVPFKRICLRPLPASLVSCDLLQFFKILFVQTNAPFQKNADPKFFFAKVAELSRQRNIPGPGKILSKKINSD